MKGRNIVFLFLLGFVLVATGVIWRRAKGIAQSRDIRELEQRRAALEAQRSALEGAIRDASGRARLARTVEERLGMRIPNDSQVIYLGRPAKDSISR